MWLNTEINYFTRQKYNINFRFLNKLNIYSPFGFRKILSGFGHTRGKYTAKSKCARYFNSYIIKTSFNHRISILIQYKYLANIKRIVGLFKMYNGCMFFNVIPSGLCLGSYTTYLLNYMVLDMLGVNLGCLIKLYNLELFTILFYIQINSKFIYAKANGTYCYINYNKYRLDILVCLNLPSGRDIIVSADNIAYLGRNSGSYWILRRYRKAQQTKFLGHMPSVRGVAQNPVDHPNGGRTKTNKPERSPWGWVAKKGK